jgi:putative membrane protein
MVNLLLRLVLSALLLMIIAYLVPGIHVGFWSALGAAIVIGLLNMFVRPVFVLLTLPLTILTFGLFVLVINGVLFAIAAWLVPGFTVHGFTAAFVGALLYALAGFVTHLIAGIGRAR